MQDRFQRSPKLIELQLLRHGETLNQLLSPLTDYFALCGDHDSGTINVPMKHRALLTKLRALDYEDSEKTQDDQLEEMTELVTEVLSRVPGLGTELSVCHQQLAHVSLATNAAELSMVPFELARMPSGTAGAGQPMCLQPHVPVCVTRRSRNVNRPELNWKRDVRILFIASDAGGEIPLQAHYANLRKLVDPWLAVPRGQGGDSPDKIREKRLKLLKNPSINEIRNCLQTAALSSESFTHIHILAHGTSCNAEATRFGVVLPSSKNKARPAVIDGEQLGAVLGYDPELQGCSPLVVTLAICQSSRQGGVIMPGSSLAFELHSNGVPLVVGSQFPLTFGGSITMARELYSGFLLGRDPRTVIWKTRRALFEETQQVLPPSSDQKSIHDWASLTAYAQLPEELDEWLPKMERDQIYGRLKPRMDHLDYLSGILDKSSSSTVDPDNAMSTADFHPNDLQKALEQIEQFEQWIDDFQWKSHVDEGVSRGILASAMKRLGIVFHRLSADRSSCEEARKKLWQHSSGFQDDRLRASTAPEFRDRLESLGREKLIDAEQQYSMIFDLDRDQGWALVQSLSLNLALHGSVLYDDFQTAMVISHRDRGQRPADRRSWALAALAELSLMRIAIQKMDLNPLDNRWAAGEGQCSEEELQRTFSQYVQDLMLLAREVPNEVRSSLLQFQRLEHDLMPMALKNSTRKKGVSEDPGALATDIKPAGSRKAGTKKPPKVAAKEVVENIKMTHISEFVQGMITPLFEIPGLQSYQ